MTTAVGSVIEVKDESEQIEQDHSEASNPEESASISQEQHKGIKEDEQPISTEQPLKEQELNSQTSNASTQASPCNSDKKEQSGGKGLSRFLPGWLKKQKSLSQVDMTEDKEAEKGIQAQTEGTDPAEKEQPEPVKTTPENEVEKKEKVEAEQAKIGEIGEQHSLNSAEIQPVIEEEKIVESLEKDADVNNEEAITEEKKEGSNKGAELHKDEDTSKKSPLKIPKKIKIVQCKVLMLDGSESTYEIEKRAKGQVLFDKVCEQINLLERDYFGLTFRDTADEKVLFKKRKWCVPLGLRKEFLWEQRMLNWVGQLQGDLFFRATQQREMTHDWLLGNF